MNSETPISIPESTAAGGENSGMTINFKRVLDRVVRFWYLVLLSLGLSLLAAYLVNRYTQKIFPVRASIIIKESEENAGAKFLYDNALINPYRNFFNEIYIMKSYPLMQQVVTDLGFEISLFREGDIVTSEYYDNDFPIQFIVAKSDKMPWGKAMYLVINDEQSFSLQYMADTDNVAGKHFSSLSFDDTVGINGFRIYAKKKSPVASLVGRRFVIKFNHPFTIAKDYSARLQATWAAPGASVVLLDINGRVAEKEVNFLNKFIERYQQYDIDKKNLVAVKAMQFLEQQLVITGDSLRMYEDRVERFKGRNVITTLDDETNRLYQKTQKLEDQKFQYRLNESYYGYISDLIRSDKYDGIFTPSSVGVTDPILANLINEIIGLQAQVNVYKSNMRLERSKENPGLITTQQRISFLKQDVLKAIENNRRTEQINVRFIDDQILLVMQQISKLPSKERELIDIQRNYSLKENLYVFLLQKRTEAGLSKASTTSDIVVVNPPMAGGAISPKVWRNYAIAVGGGLSVPVLIFVLLELLNARVQSKEDIERITSVPFIGAVGHNSSGDPLIVYNRPRSSLAESFRALRSNLNYFTSGKGHQIFMVTSTLPSEGKSFTSLNLATVLALTGKKTLLLGADLRRPKLAEELKLENRIGLSQYLSGLSSREEIIQKSTIDNLYLISGGPMPPNPSELLIRAEMATLMDTLKDEYEYIVIDTPPLSFVADAFVLSRYANHTLFVIRQNFTPYGSLASLEEYYQSGKLTNISILFNDLRKTGLGYGYGQGYSYGYGYGYGYGAKARSSHGYYEE